jgi:hypothetical protein
MSKDLSSIFQFKMVVLTSCAPFPRPKLTFLQQRHVALYFLKSSLPCHYLAMVKVNVDIIFEANFMVSRIRVSQNIFSDENNLSSVVAKRWCFLLTTHKLTPHIKAKKCTKKNYIMLQRIHAYFFFSLPFLLLSYFFLPADFFFLPFLFSSPPLLLCHLRSLSFFLFSLFLLLPCSSAISVHSLFFFFSSPAPLLSPFTLFFFFFLLLPCSSAISVHSFFSFSFSLSLSFSSPLRRWV